MLLTIYFRIFLATRRRLRKRAQANKSIMQRGGNGGRRVGDGARDNQHISKVVVNSNNVTKLDSSEDNPDEEEESLSCVGGETGGDHQTITSGSTANNETTFMTTLSRQGSLLRLRQQQQKQQTPLLSLFLPSSAPQTLSSTEFDAKLKTSARTDNTTFMTLNNSNCDVAGIVVDDDEESIALPKNINIKQSTR